MPPVAGTQLTQDGNFSPTTSQATASINPTAGNFLIVRVNAGNAGGTAPPEPTMPTANGITWDVIDSEEYTDGSSEAHTITYFRARPSSPSAGTHTINHSSAPTASIAWSITECTNPDTSGTNGSGAIDVVWTFAENQAGSTTPTVSFGALSDPTNNAIFATIALVGATTIDFEASFTSEFTETDFPSERDAMQNGDNASITGTLGTSMSWIIVAIGIKAAASGGVVDEDYGVPTLTLKQEQREHYVTVFS